MNIPKLVAHRGYMAKYPENSLAGISAALECGACLVEFDIQMNSEGKCCVLHDSNLKRTSGYDIDIFSATSERIEDISVHEPQRFDRKFFHTPVPEIVEVLRMFDRFPKAKAVVEIKEESLGHWGMEVVMDKLLKTIQPWEHRCILISFSAEPLEYAKQRSDIPIGWVLKTYEKKSLEQAVKLNPELLICNYKKLPENKPLAGGNWEWMLYDIDDPKIALQYADQGVTMIETANIGAMLENSKLSQQGC